MVIGFQRTNFSLKAEANHYMREAWRNGTSLKNANAPRTNHGLMAVLQRTVKPGVGVEHQMTTCL